ncbi:unnamed protein product, partial [Discosporangium mesarthrocarpum]
MTSRQVQWRRFTFFDKDTLAEDVAQELGTQVTCMHTAKGMLYLGDDSGRVTLSDRHFRGRTHRQAHRGPVFAVSFIPEIAAGGQRINDAALGAGGKSGRLSPRPLPLGGDPTRSGIVVTIGDDTSSPATSVTTTAADIGG